MSDKNIDKDLEIVKELVEHNYLEDINYLREPNGEHKRFNQAIENVLAELTALRRENAYLRCIRNENEFYVENTHLVTERMIKCVEKNTYKFEVSEGKFVDIKELYSELEKYKRIAKANLKNTREFRENMCEHRCPAESNYKEELETWKKIAEKLAERLGEICIDTKPLVMGTIADEVHGCDKYISCKECFLDWARNEVENGKNNNT